VDISLLSLCLWESAWIILSESVQLELLMRSSQVNIPNLKLWNNYSIIDSHCFFILFIFIFFIFYFCPFAISWAAPAAYGGSQARGRTGAAATSLRQSHSNAGSEPHLQPTPQLTATPDCQPTEQGQGPNLQPHGSWSDSLTTVPRRELLTLFCKNCVQTRTQEYWLFFSHAECHQYK